MWPLKSNRTKACYLHFYYYFFILFSVVVKIVQISFSFINLLKGFFFFYYVLKH